MRRYPLVLVALIIVGASTAVSAQSAYIRDWLVCGPFPNADAATRLSRDYLGGEAALKPTIGEARGGLQWAEYDSPQDLVEFTNPALGWKTLENAAAYAHVYVKSPAAGIAWLFLGTDDGTAVLVNSVEVWRRDVYRSHKLDQDHIPLGLAAGWNGLMVKVSQGVADWRFTAKLCDKAGNPLPGLEYAVAQPEGFVPPPSPDISAEVAKLYAGQTVHLIGNAHIDLAWLWRWPETVQVCRDTFAAALDDMKLYPGFTFTQESAAAYLWMEEQYPDLFAQIKQRVAEGRWNVVGGQWSQCDNNMPCGESQVRQFLQGQRYFLSRFGVTAKTAWSSDVFGHAWTLPQILQKSGCDSFYFCRCGKGEPLFWWQGLDGSRVLAYNRGPYGAGIDDSIADGPQELLEKAGVPEAMHMYGVGDHGGGPTREMLDRAIQMQQWKPFPKLVFSSPDRFFASAEKSEKIPTVRDELNFAFRGCYTTHADIKKANRRCEMRLLTAERLATLAAQCGYRYPQAELTDAWRKTLFNQFHDILCGSSIHPVYDDARVMCESVYSTCDRVTRDATRVLARQLDTRGEGVPVVVFNPTPWARTDVVRVRVPLAPGPGGLIARGGKLQTELQMTPGVANAPVTRAVGESNPVQVVSVQRLGGAVATEVVFVAENVPPMGASVYLVQPAQRPPGGPKLVSASPSLLENDLLRVGIDPQTGCITSVVDKRTGQENIRVGALANRLRLLEDKPAGMSAWEIGWTGVEQDITASPKIEVIESGPVRAKVRVSHRHGASVYRQDVTLYRGVPRLDIYCEVDWHERQKMLKVAFPLNLDDGTATFEIPFGVIERPADGQEVPALNWVDLTAGRNGAAVLNDCKYGYDVKNNEISLSLLRSSTDPDPTPDEGLQSMTYSLYPHSGDWRVAHVVRQGLALNMPLLPVVTDRHVGTATRWSLATAPEGVVLTALKRAEDGKGVILRLCESRGEATDATVTLSWNVKDAVETDLIERDLPQGQITVSGSTLKLSMKPWDIRTVRVTP